MVTIRSPHSVKLDSRKFYASEELYFCTHRSKVASRRADDPPLGEKSNTLKLAKASRKDDIEHYNKLNFREGAHQLLRSNLSR